MLIKLKEETFGNPTDYPALVPGLMEDNIPTSGDVHLYADPGTDGAQFPILYADCEGMTGGESTPRAIACGGSLMVGDQDNMSETNCASGLPGPTVQRKSRENTP